MGGNALRLAADVCDEPWHRGLRGHGHDRAPVVAVSTSSRSTRACCFPRPTRSRPQLEDKYGLTIRAVQPEYTVEEQAVREGAELWGREPDRCCELRKMQPLRATLANVRCLDHGDSPRSDPRAGQRAGRRVGRAVRPRESESARALDVGRCAGLRPRSRRAVQSRFTIRTTRASGACRARAPSRRARTRGQAAGAGRKRPSADSISCRWFRRVRR